MDSQQKNDELTVSKVKRRLFVEDDEGGEASSSKVPKAETFEEYKQTLHCYEILQPDNIEDEESIKKYLKRLFPFEEYHNRSSFALAYRRYLIERKEARLKMFEGDARMRVWLKSTAMDIESELETFKNPNKTPVAPTLNLLEETQDDKDILAATEQVERFEAQEREREELVKEIFTTLSFKPEEYHLNPIETSIEKPLLYHVIYSGTNVFIPPPHCTKTDILKLVHNKCIPYSDEKVPPISGRLHTHLLSAYRVQDVNTRPGQFANRIRRFIFARRSRGCKGCSSIVRDRNNRTSCNADSESKSSSLLPNDTSRTSLLTLPRLSNAEMNLSRIAQKASMLTTTGKRSSKHDFIRYLREKCIINAKYYEFIISECPVLAELEVLLPSATLESLKKTIFRQNYLTRIRRQFLSELPYSHSTSRINLLRRIRHMLSPTVAESIYTFMIQPLFLYCYPILQGMNNT